MDLCAGAASIPTAAVAQRGLFRILLGSTTVINIKSKAPDSVYEAYVATSNRNDTLIF